jgi:hypothetical protein
MKTLALTLSIVLGFTLSVVGQNFMGMNQSKIVKSMGEPDKVGANYYVYSALDEYGENIYYFDKSGNCTSFEIIREISHLEEYQKILKREFKEASQNKFVKKTKKMNFMAELILSDNTFQIKILDSDNMETSSGQMLAGVQIK